MEIKPMPIKMVKIDKLKINPSNPRVIKDYKYKKLLKSIFRIELQGVFFFLDNLKL